MATNFYLNLSEFRPTGVVEANTPEQFKALTGNTAPNFNTSKPRKLWIDTTANSAPVGRQLTYYIPTVDSITGKATVIEYRLNRIDAATPNINPSSTGQNEGLEVVGETYLPTPIVWPLPQGFELRNIPFGGIVVVDLKKESESLDNTAGFTLRDRETLREIKDGITALLAKK